MVKKIVTQEPSGDSKENTIDVTITTKGSVELMESIQGHVGFIEEKIHEQIINDIQMWMNDNYRYLVEFYARATKYKLIPGDQVNLILVENDLLRSKLKRYEDKFGRLKDGREDKSGRTKDNREAKKEEPKEEIKKEEPKEEIKSEPITVKLGIRKLKNIAKEMKIPIKMGMTKEEVCDLINKK